MRKRQEIKSDDADALLTLDQAMALLQLGEWTITRKAPRIKVGRAVRYSRRQLMAWAASKTQTQDPKGGAV